MLTFSNNHLNSFISCVTVNSFPHLFENVNNDIFDTILIRSNSNSSTYEMHLILNSCGLKLFEKISFSKGI